MLFKSFGKVFDFLVGNLTSIPLLSDFKELDTYPQGNWLSLNVAKTHAMLICTKPKHKTLGSQDRDLKLKIHDNDLE